MNHQHPTSDSLLTAYLSAHGYSGKKLEEKKSGFDQAKPCYEQRLNVGDIIYQFVRLTRLDSIKTERLVTYDVLPPRLGNWFCLRGARMGELAIISGNSGRAVAKVRVRFSLTALEGTAAPQPIDWNWSGGGVGGATQIFIPDKYLLSHVEVLGYATELREFADI